MELKDFIETAITELIHGVHAAQKSTKEIKGAAVNPDYFDRQYEIDSTISNSSYEILQGQPVRQFNDADMREREERKTTNIEFDIAISAGNEEEAKAGLKVKVASLLGAEAGASLKEQNSSTSRIKFSVPIILPTHYETNCEDS
ncbi:trypco2 family protein [Pseudoteredinibacter isoporae]|uniref:Uncharacterized protein n=1 Tax=Pseudoteredinibacter isoporae TaxID=570281 RepID=A0A7X0JWA8_9GAMM|nr:trypco2 family protein [Pseudoteredinibacter isoporae]MBB6523004.1 hypothetical protein [Pseudoteredinibacter isoporae]NHO88527.1 hypothetical protein [Pseudoteredinibacter isoporae]NIB22782.1 hypothetical protein [Pseudoteredinibacter isoporae]